MKKLSIIAVFFFSIVLFSCGDAENKTNNNNEGENNVEETNNTETNNTEEFANEEFAFTEMPISKNDVSTDLYKGTWHTAKKWSDKNGENIFIISYFEKKHKETSEYDEALTKEIHGYHYVVNNGENKLIREVQDFENKCGFENRLRLAQGSLSLTDLNNDNYGEICFAYYLGCTSEYSHDGIKLMFLENGEKYAIRGTTNLAGGMISENPIPGETKVDGTFKNAPEEFLTFANGVWAKLQEHGKY